VLKIKKKDEDKMETLLIEIRGAEGGEDAKLLAADQFRVYAKVAARRGL
jgi:protein subunit release factor A